MPQLIDRRLNPRDKSLGNRQRFLRRTREQIKKAVDKAVRERGIADASKGGSVSIPSDGIGEPQFAAMQRSNCRHDRKPKSVARLVTRAIHAIEALRESR